MQLGMHIIGANTLLCIPQFLHSHTLFVNALYAFIVMPTHFHIASPHFVHNVHLLCSLCSYSSPDHTNTSMQLKYSVFDHMKCCLNALDTHTRALLHIAIREQTEFVKCFVPQFCNEFAKFSLHTVYTGIVNSRLFY